MTTISAKVIAHSECDRIGKQICTFQLRYPRFIHAEFMTHRQFSRNASSSRAIPVERLIQDIMDDPAVPMFWGANQKGMQAGAECDETVHTYGWGGGGPWPKTNAWLLARNNAVRAAKAFSESGYHKQIANRLLEPFAHINVVVTATEWSNFFALRDHPDAEPHIQMLAREMRKALSESNPTIIRYGEWHVPYVNSGVTECEADVKRSVARCARVSYLTHEGRVPTPEEDLQLYDRLVGRHPIHASPAEHQATPDPYSHNEDHWGNFQGFIQYRKTLIGECQ